MSAERYDRQSRLPEIGDAGQARLAAAHVRVRGNEDAAVERLYLARAGVGRLESAPAEQAEPFTHARAFVSEPARSVAAAAWRALAAIRRELEIGP